MSLRFFLLCLLSFFILMRYVKFCRIQGIALFQKRFKKDY